MLKPNNRKNLFLQEFFAVLPNLSVDNINVMLNGINTELESRKLTQYAKDGNFLNWSTATEIAWKMANADCDDYGAITNMASPLLLEVPANLTTRNVAGYIAGVRMYVFDTPASTLLRERAILEARRKVSYATFLFRGQKALVRLLETEGEKLSNLQNMEWT